MMSANPKMLREHTDKELYEFLKNNELHPMKALGAVSSEILKRLIDRKEVKFNEE